jgi:hypothetical protein
MFQSTSNSKGLELTNVENDIAQVLKTTQPPRDHRAPEFVPSKSRPPSAMPSYPGHRADVDQIGKLSAEAVVAQYEGAVKALEAMGTTLIDCVQRAEKMAAGCKDAIAYVQDTAQKYRDEAKLIFDRIQKASVMTAEVKSVCDEMRKKIETPAHST